jgi:hypothetical protein
MPTLGNNRSDGAKRADGALIFNRSNDYLFAGDILQGFGSPGRLIQRHWCGLEILS